MIVLALLIAAAPDIDVGKPLISSHLYVGGWYCTPPGCESERRRFGAALKFSDPIKGAVFANAEPSAREWEITLDCAVSKRKLIRCDVQDYSSDLPVAKRVAVKIAQSATLDPTQPPEKRAIVQISYNPSSCVSWMGCVTEMAPPPPPPPPEQSSGS